MSRTPKQPKVQRLVRIEWLDSRIHPGWADGTSYDNPPMFTVGYLTKKTQKNTFVAGTWDTDKGNFADVSCVPNGCIVSVVELVPKEEPPCVEPLSPSSSSV